ncbi:anti-sigma factor family protein [Ferribacterium limneticum]|uniref:anti-sigma factor family protein n=1 Tax=Ferribacterium limneticum TaxID=76259 RepID=UPI001CF8904C|nr:anti-sigma factor [Ferribacterium limneticum]UCV23446.1 anti-sigma factor [Ferribacterium limneticum]
MSPLNITEDDLHAYVDGALTAARRAEIEAYLVLYPEDAERVRAYRAQNEALKALFNPVLVEALPDHLQALTVQPVNSTVNRKKWPNLKSWPLQQIAAGVIVATLGGVAGWLGHGQYQSAEHMAQVVVPLSRQAAVAHVVYSPDARRPVEVTADQEEALVKWLTKRIGTPVTPPKLGALGYELVGGRLLPGNAGPVAQFMYQDATGQRMTLYVTTENATQPETGFRFAREGQVNVFYWVDGKFGYALSASTAKGELAKVATAVYDQLEAKK